MPSSMQRASSLTCCVLACAFPGTCTLQAAYVKKEVSPTMLIISLRNCERGVTKQMDTLWAGCPDYVGPVQEEWEEVYPSEAGEWGSATDDDDR